MQALLAIPTSPEGQLYKGCPITEETRSTQHAVSSRVFVVNFLPALKG
jgi:hypothetical protein